MRLGPKPTPTERDGGANGGIGTGWEGRPRPGSRGRECIRVVKIGILPDGCMIGIVRGTVGESARCLCVSVSFPLRGAVPGSRPGCSSWVSAFG